ncbi:RSH2 [Scenedesmus sp. PABB004]|nr:RSH2 [Scenedesmus sp. PABB004]
MAPLGLLGSSPALASSPPARSATGPVPIKAGGRAALSKSVPAAAPHEALGPELARRTSETAGGRKLSFSKTPASASAAASGPGSGGRPPAGPSAVAQVCVGFAPAPEAAPLVSSPGRRATQSSLLSRALLGSELFGASAPSGAFQGLVVLPDRAAADLTSGVDMGPLRRLQEQHPVFRGSNAAAAYALAARAHAGQARKNGETVLSHVCATALILAELGLPEDVVAAGLLHDVLDDTPTQRWQLEALLPGSVVGLVARVSQLNQLSQAYRDNTHTLEAEAMLDMLTSMDDVSALLIKLADRLHNMRTISALPRCKQVRMASETLDVFAVLANRLGAWAIKAELEDLSFAALNPEEYALVAAAVAERAASEAGAALAGGVEEVTAALAAAGLEVVDVSGRVKNVYGVWRKVQKAMRARAARASGAGAGDAARSSDGEDGAPPSPAAAAAAAPSPFATPEARAAALAEALAGVHDIQALRVVVPHKHDCYAAMRVVAGVWDVVPGRVKDYIRQRKANGYQSLHLTVRDARGQALEVQIRTPKMHYIAEYGFAAHWRYKERLGRQDLWLDRLVQWKKWVASEKLGILDRKLRPSGSPGGGAGGDAALAGLASRLGLEAGAGGGGAPLRSVSAGDAFVAELLAASGGEPAPAPAGVAPSSSPADERFAARFRMEPISEAELDQHGAAVMISGPRGAAIAQLPARCTVAQLLGSRALAGHLAAARGAGAGAPRGLATTAAPPVQLAVNGVVVMPGQADAVVLRSGDQLQVLDDPHHLPLRGVAAGDAGRGGAAPDQAPALPGALAGAGESLQLFVPGAGEAMELALQRKLHVPARAPARAPALVS